MKTRKDVKEKGEKLKEEHKRYENDSNSEDDMPDVVSNSAMKEDLQTLNKELANLKQQLRQAEKAKRRKKQERFIAQKKSKMSDGLDDEKDADADDPETNNPILNTDEADEDAKKSSKQTRKVYPTFNVTVEPLTKTDDIRASAALDFKSRRLANVPRESIKNAVISYQKKLEVRK